jgi:probable rRNA maturation factor
MTITIEVPEAYQSLVDVELLQQAVRCVLAAERTEGDVTVKITDDDEVAALNQQFLGKEGPTDVLSFPAGPDDEAFVLPPEEAQTPYLGDILIALPYTQRQAQRAGRALQDELALLAVHGALHLMGYDHATPAEKAEMWDRQNAILSGLGIPPLED